MKKMNEIEAKGAIRIARALILVFLVFILIDFIRRIVGGDYSMIADEISFMAFLIFGLLAIPVIVEKIRERK